MRGFQWVLLCAILFVKTRNSFAVVEFFKDCADDDDCPDNSDCVQLDSTQECRCRPGYDAIDLPFTSGGIRVTECKDLGPCSPFDNIESDCGPNGDCVTYVDSYAQYKTACRCSSGYYGPNCDRTGPSTGIPPYTNRPPYRTTRRPGNVGAIIPAIGGGVLLLALLAGGAAALASSSG